MVGPRFTGAGHAASIELRRDSQMSKSPTPPGRFESNHSVRPSAETNGCRSSSGPLIAVPRLTGVLHSKAGDVSNSYGVSDAAFVLVGAGATGGGFAPPAENVGIALSALSSDFFTRRVTKRS